jgi:hypothetical protein
VKNYSPRSTNNSAFEGKVIFGKCLAWNLGTFKENKKKIISPI